MTLTEILGRIDDLRKSASGLADDCYKVYCDLVYNAYGEHTKSAAKYLHYELTTIACRLSDLAETETEEDYTPYEDLAGEIEDWWDELSYEDKSEISNIPRPTSFDGRGESDCEFEDRTILWWNSRTYDQKKEIYDEWADEL